MEENNSNLEKVLGNNLIGEVIVSYLSFDDMKMASLAFRGLHGMVRSSQRFATTTALRLTRWSFEEILPEDKPKKFEHFQLSSEFWGLVEFDTTVSSEILKFLEINSAILANITTLRLTREVWKMEELVFEREKIQGMLKTIFDNCHNVVELRIDLELLMTQDLKELLQPGFSERIKSLDINTEQHYWEEEGLDEVNLMLQNLQYFLGESEMKLESFKVSIKNHYESVIKAIVDLINSKRETLHSLDLDISTKNSFLSSGLKVMANTGFPNLKQFHIQKIYKDPEQADGLVKFLQNQLGLENLRVSFKHECPAVFMEYLEKNAKSLRSLELAAYCFETSIDWKFLGDCVKLKELTIIRERALNFIQYEFKATGVYFLTFLPPSTTKLSLRGVKDFWKLQGDLTGDQIPDAQIISLLSRFPLMTKLDLIGCKDGVVTDLAMQTIITKMPKLALLKFSHGSCTDYGLTGIRDGEVVGVSLTELKGLTHLAIRSCRSITAAGGLLMSVKHSSLQSLEYIRNQETTSDQVEQLVSQNPLLHLLAIRVEKDCRIVLIKNLIMTRHWRKLRLYESDDDQSDFERLDLVDPGHDSPASIFNDDDDWMMNFPRNVFTDAMVAVNSTGALPF